MTVGELRDALEDFDEDLPVLVTEYAGIGLVEVSDIEDAFGSYAPGVILS